MSGAPLSSNQTALFGLGDLETTFQTALRRLTSAPLMAHASRQSLRVLLKLAFRGFRMHSAFGSTSASADETSRRASPSSPAPTQEMMQTDGGFAITVSSSPEKRTVSVRDGESSRDRSHSRPSHRARRDAAGSKAARGLSGTSTMGGPSIAVYVYVPLPPSPPSCLPQSSSSPPSLPFRCSA